MAKGYKANMERQGELAALGKAIGKRAGFKCEWCEGKDELRVWDYQPEMEPEPANLALLCGRCRELADGARADSNELRSIGNALWSDIPAVAEGAACVLARCKEPWAREVIEESFIDEAIKARLLK